MTSQGLSIYGNRSPCLIKPGFPGGSGTQMPVLWQLSGLCTVLVRREQPSPAFRTLDHQVEAQLGSPSAWALTQPRVVGCCSVISGFMRLENRAGSAWLGLGGRGPSGGSGGLPTYPYTKVSSLLPPWRAVLMLMEHGECKHSLAGCLSAQFPSRLSTHRLLAAMKGHGEASGSQVGLDTQFPFLWKSPQVGLLM